MIHFLEDWNTSAFNDPTAETSSMLFSFSWLHANLINTYRIVWGRLSVTVVKVLAKNNFFIDGAVSIASPAITIEMKQNTQPRAAIGEGDAGEGRGSNSEAADSKRKCQVWNEKAIA